MSTLTNIKKEYTPDKNFWELNPQLIIMQPFSKLYNRDKSKDKENSSKEMWSIFFCCEPDEEINKFYRIPLLERQKMLKETLVPKIDWEEDLDIIECLNKYPIICLSAIERALKEEIDNMVAWSEFIRRESRELTLDKTQIVNGKAIIIKGNAAQVANLKAKTPKLYEQYEKLEEKFIKQKTEARLRGGRKKSKREKGELFTELDGTNVAGEL